MASIEPEIMAKTYVACCPRGTQCSEQDHRLGTFDTLAEAQEKVQTHLVYSSYHNLNGTLLASETKKGVYYQFCDPQGRSMQLQGTEFIPCYPPTAIGYRPDSVKRERSRSPVPDRGSSTASTKPNQENIREHP